MHLSIALIRILSKALHLLSDQEEVAFLMMREFLQGRRIHHPLHPMVVHLPVGLWVASLIFDITFLIGGRASIATASYYCILIGVLGASLAILTGIAELKAIPRGSQASRIAWTHLTLAIVTTVLYVLNLESRYRTQATPTFITSGQFILSIFSLILLSMTGYLGGLLIYNYGIGFKPQLRSTEPEKQEKQKKAA